MSDRHHSDQVDRNFEAFQSKLPELLPHYAGKVAVLHDAEVVELFDSVADAVRYGQRTYGTAFSVQEVAAPKQSLGFYSYAAGQFS